ncbi:spermidine synthase [Nautilia sp.]
MTQTQKEMMALVGACTQEAGDRFLVPDVLNGEFDKILTKKFELFNEDTEKKYDLIIEEKPGDLIKVYEKLNDKGIYITTASSLEDRELFANLSKLFYIVMPYYFIEDSGERKSLVFASKEIHPTADLIRHRSDFVENTHYYHTDIHLASFVLPKYIFEYIKDVIKP